MQFIEYLCSLGVLWDNAAPKLAFADYLACLKNTTACYKPVPAEHELLQTEASADDDNSNDNESSLQQTLPSLASTSNIRAWLNRGRAATTSSATKHALDLSAFMARLGAVRNVEYS